MPGVSLSPLLSQVLVAFTIELDNEFERQMREAGFPGARLSFVLWTNLLRFVGDGVTVRELAIKALAPATQIKFQLGCLERWRIVTLLPDNPGESKRAGWGSARGIRADQTVRLTPTGRLASVAWPPLLAEIERRWDKRFGKDRIDPLRQALRSVVDKLDLDLPIGLPPGGEGADEFPSRSSRDSRSLALPALLSQLLLTFRLEFDRESTVPLLYCANTLRVLGENPVRLAEVPRLTGGSPETSDIGWQLKPYVVIAPDPLANRGKIVRLSPRGLKVQQSYHRLMREIESRWEVRFGADAISLLHTALEKLFDGPHLSQGMIPPSGTARAGDEAPALGRRDVGAAARRRMRDLVAQTEAFVRDPAGSLPHYPAWDMNRGFGP